MTAGEFVYLIKADSSSLNSSLDKAESTVKSVGDKLTSWTVAKGQMVANFAMKAVKEIAQLPSKIVGVANEISAFGDKIDKQSQVLGMTRKAYQEWDYILGQNGASIDSMSVSVKTLNSMLVSGSKEGKEAMSQLGLSIEDINKMDMEGQFEAVVRAFQKMPAGAEKSALAVKLFGRNGMELLPLLNQSADSLDTLRQEAQDFGLIMGDDMVDASVKYGDTVDLMKRSFNALKMTVGQGLLPTFTRASEIFAKFAGRITAAFKKGGFGGALSEAKTMFSDFVNNLRNSEDPVASAVGKIASVLANGLSWETIGEAVEGAWETVKLGVEGLAKIVFGENVDGTIAWPTWEDIGEAIGQAWNGIVEGVKGLAKLVFGENVDGTIAWPTWKDIETAVGEAWKGIIDGVKGLGTGIGKVVFGENVDGTIKWPTWEEIGTSITEAWNWIVENVDQLPTLIFGEDTVVGKALQDAFDWCKEAIAEIKRFLGIGTDSRAGQTSLTLSEADTLKSGYQMMLDTKSGKNKSHPVSEETFYNKLRTTLEGAGKEAGEVDSIIEKIRTAEDPQWVLDFIESLTEANSTATTLGEAVEGVAGDYDVNYHFHTFGDTFVKDRTPGNKGFRPKAAGMLTVPYDNFPALLHRGERVQTASQARHNGGGYVDYGAVAEMIGYSIENAMSKLYLNMDGNKVADFTTRRTERNINANAFSRTRAMGG